MASESRETSEDFRQQFTALLNAPVSGGRNAQGGDGTQGRTTGNQSLRSLSDDTRPMTNCQTAPDMEASKQATGTHNNAEDTGTKSAGGRDDHAHTQLGQKSSDVRTSGKLMEQLQDKDFDAVRWFNDQLSSSKLGEILLQIDQLDQALKTEQYQERKMQQKQLSDAIIYASTVSGNLLSQQKELGNQLQLYYEQQQQLNDVLVRISGVNARPAVRDADQHTCEQQLQRLEEYMLQMVYLICQRKYLTAVSYIHVLAPIIQQERFKGHSIQRQLGELTQVLVDRVVGEAVSETKHHFGGRPLIVNKRLFTTVFQDGGSERILDDCLVFLLNQITIEYEKKGLPNAQQIVDQMLHLDTVADDDAAGQNIILTQQKVLYYVICYFGAFGAYFAELRKRAASDLQRWPDVHTFGSLEIHSGNETIGPFVSYNQAYMLDKRLDTLYIQTIQLVQMKQVCQQFCFQEQYKRLQIYIQQFIQSQFQDSITTLINDVFRPQRTKFKSFCGMRILQDVIDCTDVLLRYKNRFQYVGYALDDLINSCYETLVSNSIAFGLQEVREQITAQEDGQDRDLPQYYTLVCKELDYSDLYATNHSPYGGDADGEKHLGILRYLMEPLDGQKIDQINNNSAGYCFGLYTAGQLRFIQYELGNEQKERVARFGGALTRLVIAQLHKHVPHNAFVGWLSGLLTDEERDLLEHATRYGQANENAFIISVDMIKTKFLQVYTCILQVTNDSTLECFLGMITQATRLILCQLSEDLTLKVFIDRFAEQLAFFIYVIPFLVQVLVTKHPEMEGQIVGHYHKLCSETWGYLQLNATFLAGQLGSLCGKALTNLKLQLGEEVLQVLQQETRNYQISDE